MHANFQASCFTGVGGGGGDRQTDKEHQAFLNRSLYKISKLPPLASLGMDKLLEIFSGNFPDMEVVDLTQKAKKIHEKPTLVTLLLSFASNKNYES